MTFATMMGSGTLHARDGRCVTVRYLLENSPDLLSLGPCQQHGTLDFSGMDTSLVHERGPLPLDLENGRRVHITVEDRMPLDAAGGRYAVSWW